MASRLLSTSAPLLAVLALSGLAPFQCGTSDPAEAGIEETPGEALYRLAQEFEKAGDREGHVRVLRHLIMRQPKSRFARTAHDDLVRMGELPEGTPFPGDRDVPPADPAAP